MRHLLGINLEVICDDGSCHTGVKLYNIDNRRVYLAEDGSEIHNVQEVTKCMAVVPPTMLAMALHACEECD